VTLYLIRHGETDWNREPARCQGWAEVRLNETGRVQARDQGRALAGRGLQLVVTSHLPRARETAELIVQALGGDLPIVVDPRLAEAHRGDWEGRRFKDIVAEEPALWHEYRRHPEAFRFPGGESLVDQQRRVLAAVRDAAQDGRTALLVTHGGSIRLLRCFLEGFDVGALHDLETRDRDVYEVETEGLGSRIGAFLEGPSEA
jgi:broad specificity phosphatase PhoE